MKTMLTFALLLFAGSASANDPISRFTPSRFEPGYRYNSHVDYGGWYKPAYAVPVYSMPVTFTCTERTVEWTTLTPRRRFFGSSRLWR